MPEGDTVHKLATAIGPDLLGQTLVAGSLTRLPRARLTERQVSEVRALGKHLLIEFADGLTLRSHLGMYGSWHRYRPGEPWRRPAHSASLVLETARTVLVCFNAAQVELLQTGGFGERDLEARLGPDLAQASPDLGTIVHRARTLCAPETPLVDLLLSQRIAAGIGNVYKSELLFLQRLDPEQPLSSLTDADLIALYTRARQLLRRNLGAGPRRTRFDPDGDGLWVYRRRGRPCLVCGTAIAYRRMGKDLRGTYWCPVCQSDALA